MINVLSIVPYQVLPAKFGGQKGIALFNKYFATQVNLVCVTTRNNDPAAAEGYEVLNILSNSPLRYINLFYFFTLRKIIRQRQITHLQIEHPYYGWLGILLKKYTGVQLIVHSHNIEGLRWKMLGKWWWKILLNYEGMTHRKADYNFFIHKDDAAFAVQELRVPADKCLVVTYGTVISESPSLIEKERARQYLLQRHNIPPHHHILLFNGAFNYAPNLEGLQNISGHINPQLQSKSGFAYTILICGSNIPEPIDNQAPPNMILAGLVDDIDVYFKGADIFINPVTIGGGIKTKLVEALANGANAVSTVHGAIGVDQGDCGYKLIITGDNDWQEFAKAIIRVSKVVQPTPASFYEFFYWENIARRAAVFIAKNNPAA